MKGKKVLLIDDDLGLLRLISNIFKEAGVQVIVASDGLEGISQLYSARPDLVILDVMLPGGNGIEICKKIVKFSNTPVILLTALDQDEYILEGLDAGADDYITKPFNTEILLARARSVLRRSEQPNVNISDFSYDDGRLRIDVDKHEIFINGKQIKLTPIEFRLLIYLAERNDKVLPFNDILRHVWGSGYEGSDDYVHVYISLLRRKIEQDVRNPRYIKTVHGVGYLFEKQHPEN